ncbi:MAG: hypothetical protein AAF515_19385 [Pseudomonadota bacterium]
MSGSALSRWPTLGIALLLAGCVTQTLRTVDMTPPEQLVQAPSEALLLDVGIHIFDPNVPEDYDEQIRKSINPEVRRAEANFMAYVQKNLLQSSGNWGAVRVIPRETHAVDLVLSGRILHSDGESIELDVSAVDARGVVWLNKRYEALASKYAYEDTVPVEIDPFQSVYRDVANDLLAVRANLTDDEVTEIRRTAEIRFAQSFAPDAFGEHVSKTEQRSGKQRFEVQRLPAENDPMLARVRKIREREYLFIDTLDEHYGKFHQQMYRSYQDWRSATYDEAIQLKKLRAQARSRAVAGAAAIAGGVAAQSSSSTVTNVGGYVGIIGGAVSLRSALEKRASASIHADVLEELGSSAEAEISPYTIELENESVRLQGSVDKQYEELRGILRDIYFEEVGLPNPAIANTEEVAAEATDARAEQ